MKKILYFLGLIAAVAVGFFASNYINARKINELTENWEAERIAMEESTQEEKTAMIESREKLKTDIYYFFEDYISSYPVRLLESLTYGAKEYRDSVILEYADMTDDEKIAWFDNNKAFYKGIDEGQVVIDPFLLPYFYKDNAGNNLVIHKVLDSYYNQYKLSGGTTILVVTPYGIGAKGTGPNNQTYDEFIAETYISDIPLIRYEILEMIKLSK